MDIWLAVVLASLVVWAVKSTGYAIPQKFVEGALMTRVASVVTVALLASLVASQTLQAGTGVILDARVPAIAVAGVLLYFRAPFLVVLLVAGGVAAGLRVLGVLA